MTRRAISFAAAAIFSAALVPANAQILGNGGLVDRTVGGVTGAVVETTDTLTGDPLAARQAALANIRHQQIALLYRTHRDEIVLDRHEEPAIRGEALAVSPGAEALARAQEAGYVIARRESLSRLGVDLVVLRAPDGVSTRRAIRRLRKLDPDGTYDYNHVYLGSGEVGAQTKAPAADEKTPGAPAAGSAVRVGLIDGGVETTHGAFAGAHIVQRAFSGDGPVPTSHGTAAASLIAGKDAVFAGSAPGATLYAADVFGGVPTGGAADAIAAAFDWLASENVPVINASLVGPANAALEAVVKAVRAKGIVIVAAVGNDGPSAPPLYPASYDGVIGVTAVDSRDRAIVEAARGEQVDFAAPGADMAAAGLQDGYYEVRGTSFSAPIVAGLIARGLSAPNPASAQDAEAALVAQAEDLGRKGRDKVYGDGLVGEALRVSPSVFAAR